MHQPIAYPPHDDATPREATAGVVVAVCVGSGGIPKHAVESAQVTKLGLIGDEQRYTKIHGGANRAVCLFSIEDYRSLLADGVKAQPPGAFGENVLTDGLDYTKLRPGDRLLIGGKLAIEIHDVREPCGTLKSVDARFPNLMLGRSGFVCRVVTEGTVSAGMNIRPV